MPLLKEFLFEAIDITNFRHSDNGEFPKMRINHDGLWIAVAYYSDACTPFEFREFVFKFGAEISVFNAVYAPAEAFLFRVIRCHTGPSGAEMRVVVHSVKQFISTGILGCRSEKNLP